MDFSKMNGYEFEDYITALLKNMGFKTSQTGYSNDGGIDIIAEYDKPIFKGKYIVQCKKYTGLVGQPEIRDLYGVVMSENANKGIIITPSDFTEQAYEFAKNKNLELINGTILSSIITQNGNNVELDNSLDVVTYDGFNYDQYNYIKDKIKENPKDKQNYLDMLQMLWDYVIDDADFLMPLKIFDQIVDYIFQMIKKCFRKNDSRVWVYNDIARVYILTGNLGEATNILLDNNSFYIKSYQDCIFINNEIIKHNGILVVVPQLHFSPSCVWNLLSAYYLIGYYRGYNVIIKSGSYLKDITKEIAKGIPTNASREHSLQVINTATEICKNLINGRYNDSFFYPISKKSKHYKNLTLEYDYCENHYLNLPLSKYKKYYTKSDEEIRNDIDKAFRQHGIEIASEDNIISDEFNGSLDEGIPF